jgi:ribosome biogenesis GTPase
MDLSADESKDSKTMSKRRLSKHQKGRIQSIQDQRRERAIAKNAVTDNQLNDLAKLGPEVLGTVVTNFGAQVDIEAAEASIKGQIVRCHMRANLDNLVTGDKVVWRFAEPHGVDVARQPRSSELIRPDIYGKLRPVAANVDLIVIVFSPKPTAFSNLLDRYLIASEAQNIKPLLVLNKTDMLDGEEFDDIHQLISDYKFIGYDLLQVSAKTGQGLEALQHYLKDNTAIFVGQSGVGKSSLVNHLQPNAEMRVGPLSVGKEKGTHTTTTSKLFHLTGGGVLIDSPGIREFGLSHLTKSEIIESFIDFRPYLGRCKFRDCSHNKDVGCSLIKAVEDKKVLASRLHNYRQILLSLESERKIYS